MIVVLSEECVINNVFHRRGEVVSVQTGFNPALIKRVIKTDAQIKAERKAKLEKLEKLKNRDKANGNIK